jgi:hypothetical protein
MNLIDKVILEWSYRTKKGYPDINSQEDIALFESTFGFKLLSENAFERQVTQQLINKFPETLGALSNDYRVSNKGKIESNEFIQYIKDTFGSETEVKIVPPKQSPNRSRSFDAFLFKVDGREVNINLAGGKKSDTTERQEKGVIDAINSVEGIKTVIGANNFKIENIVKADKVTSAYRHEPYADIQFIIKGKDDPFMISAKGTSSPTLAGGGLSGFTLFGDKVRKFIFDFYNDAYKYYKNIFDKNDEITYETDLYRTDLFPDVNREVPSELILEIMKGTSAMGGPVDAYYIGPMDVVPEINNNTITFDGDIIPVEKFAKESKLFVHIRKRDGSYFFTDTTQTVNNLTVPRIFTKKPGSKSSQARLGSNSKPRNKVII